MLSLFCEPLLVRNGLMVGKKSLDFIPPPHRCAKYSLIDCLFNFVTKFLCLVNLLQFLSVLHNFLRRAFLRFIALRNSEFMTGALFLRHFFCLSGICSSTTARNSMS